MGGNVTLTINKWQVLQLIPNEVIKKKRSLGRKHVQESPLEGERGEKVASVSHSLSYSAVSRETCIIHGRLHILVNCLLFLSAMRLIGGNGWEKATPVSFRR